MSDENTPQALRLPFGLKLSTWIFLSLWLVIAAFPLLWIVVMSFKLPIDSFASNPFQVIFGYETLKAKGGLSLLDVLLGLTVIYYVFTSIKKHGENLARYLSGGRSIALGWLLASVVCLFLLVLLFVWVLPMALSLLNAILIKIPLIGILAKPFIGLTWQHYEAVWIGDTFYKQFINSLLVTAGVVTISLTVGTLAGYGLARSGSQLAFWLLMVALIFRALPHSVLVTGYLTPFLNSSEWLQPLWDNPVVGWFFRLFSDRPPTLYGEIWAVVIVLVSINQPFTIWMMRSFFQNVPKDLDEAALVDGCNRLQAFWRVIMPVMWPGVITTGLFSFLLAYNDYLVTSLLLDAQSQTMVPAITGYFNRETTTTDQVEAVAAAVSITAPLFLLVMVFQKQIVSGLTEGAVKG